MVIELGDVSTPMPERHATPWRPIGSLRRTLPAAIAIVLALALLTSSARVPGTAPRPVASLPIGADARLLVSDGHAIVVDSHGNAGAVTSYAIPGGAREWSSPVAGTVSMSDAFVSGGTIVVNAPAPDTITFDTTPGTGDGSGSAITRYFIYSGEQMNLLQGIDLRSGRLLWRQPVEDAEAVRSGILEHVVDDTMTESVRVVDPATGVPRWSVTIPAGCAEYGQPDPAALVEICTVSGGPLGETTGTVERIDIGTGAVTAHDTFAFPADSRYPASPPEPLFVGDTIAVTQRSASDASIAVFRADDLTALWSRPSIVDSVYVGPCGRFICTVTADGSALAFDADTGTEIQGGPPVPTTQDVVSNFAIPTDTTLVVALPLGQSAPGLPSERIDFEEAVPAATASVLDGAASGNTWLARATTVGEDITIRPIWYLPGFRDGCIVVGGYLACTVPGGHVDLWALPW